MAVDEDLIVALAVHEDLAVGVDRKLRHLADDLFEGARLRLGVVLDRVGEFLGVGRDDRPLHGQHHRFDLDALRKDDVAQVDRFAGSREGLRMGRVADHRDREGVVARLFDRERETARSIGGDGRHGQRVAQGGDRGITHGLPVGTDCTARHKGLGLGAGLDLRFGLDLSCEEGLQGDREQQ